MEGQKITFGFSKVIKKPQLLPLKNPIPTKNKIELITSLEGKEIKLADEKPKEKETPLVIPLKDSSKSSKALESLKVRQAVLEGQEIEKKNDKTKTEEELEKLNNSNLDTLEKRAIVELLNEAKNTTNGTEKDGIYSTLAVAVKAEDLPLDGAKESSLDDYENIPIKHFGMAMLRGMGLKDEEIKKVGIDDDIICPRPKGMGLGADKAVKKQPILIPPEENEKLEIKKNAYVKVLAGKYKSQYAQIEGFDDRNGRIFIRLAIGGTKESLGEYLMQPVSKKEYETYGKVLNLQKFNEYKMKESEILAQNVEKDRIKREKLNDAYDKYNIKEESNVKIKGEYFKIKAEKYEDIKPEIDRKVKDEESSSSNIKNNRYEEEKHSKKYEKEYNQDKRYEYEREEKYSKRRSRSRDLERKRNDSVSNSSDSDSPVKYRHKSSKKKSKSKKSKKYKKKYSSDDSSEDDIKKRHKKSTKKSKRSRSRSRSRHRR